MAPRIVAASLIAFAAMTNEALQQQRTQLLAGVVTTLLEDLKNGTGDKDRRRQVEEWMRTLAEKYPSAASASDVAARASATSRSRSGIVTR